MSRAEESPLPLDDVLSPRVAFEWSHGVAIVLQLVEQLAPSGEPLAGSFPNVDRIALSSSGFLLTQLELSEGQPLAGLGRLLHRMVGQMNPPAAVRLLVMRAAAARPTITFDEVVRELRQWDSADRLSVLGDLFTRAQSSQSAPAPVEEPVDSETGEVDPVRATSLFSQVIVAGAGAATVSVLVTFLWYLPKAADNTEIGEMPSIAIPTVGIEMVAASISAPVLPPNSGIVTTDEPVGSTPAESTVALSETSNAGARAGIGSQSRFARAAGSAEPMAAVAPRAPAPASARLASNLSMPLPSDPDTVGYSPVVMRQAEERFRRGRTLFEEQDYVAAAAAFREVVAVLEQGNPTLELRQIAAELAGASRALSANIRTEPTRVYTSADEGVTEPVARAKMPPSASPSTRAEDLGVLELLIDTRGHVESAHLIGVDQHFRDRWWISAAKAWLFDPALKEGQPVRFLKRHTFLLGGAQ